MALVVMVGKAYGEGAGTDYPILAAKAKKAVIIGALPIIFAFFAAFLTALRG